MSNLLAFGRARWAEIIGCVVAAALLIWLLLGVVRDSQARTNRTTCLTNLRLVGQAMGQYVQDYDDCWPDESVWRKGKFAKGGVALAGCPGAKPMLNPPRMKTDGIPGYAYNRMLSVKITVDETMKNVVYHPARTTNIAFPATTISVCEQAIGISTTTSVDPYKDAPSRPAAQEQGGKRHGGGAHYLFCDGHVQWLRPEGVRDFSDMGGNDGKIPAFFTAAGTVPKDHPKH